MNAIDTPLTRDFPSVAQLSRPELEQLVANFDPMQPSTPWYAQQQQHASSSSSSSQQSPSSSKVAATAPPAEEHAFELFVESLPEIKALRNSIDQLTAQSAQRASHNASLQPALESLRAEVQHLYDRAVQLRDLEWPTVQREMGEARRKLEPQTLLARLSQSATRLHDSSESFASAYVEGLTMDAAMAEAGIAAATTTTTQGQEADVAFVRQYRSMRTVYHKRNIMADRWAKGTVS